MTLELEMLVHTTMAEMTKVLIKPLIGHNYVTWKVQCKMVLIIEGLWKIVTGAGVPESENDRPKYLLRKDRTLATIFLSGEPALLNLLGPDPEKIQLLYGGSLQTSFKRKHGQTS